jgi:hypothetical protein
MRRAESLREAATSFRRQAARATDTSLRAGFKRLAENLETLAEMREQQFAKQSAIDA